MPRMLYETHSHTPLCNHAIGLPSEYAAVAEANGLRGLIVTCHNPMPAGFSPRVRMRHEEFPEYVALVSAARDAWRGKIDVRLGLEADYFEGHEQWVAAQLDATEFHYVLGSVHPQIDEYRTRYQFSDPREVQRNYFRLLAQAAETRLFDCLAHPDLIKNETVGDWEPADIMDDVRRCLDRVAATGMAMELNTSGINKRIAEMNPFPAMLVEMRERNIPVVIGADAHEPARVGDGYGAALELLSSCGYEYVSYFLERARCDVPIVAAQESLTAATASTELPSRSA
jgi:histidinol-phosphatase (PHP family)